MALRVMLCSHFVSVTCDDQAGTHSQGLRNVQAMWSGSKGWGGTKLRGNEHVGSLEGQGSLGFTLGARCFVCTLRVCLHEIPGP